MKTYKNITIDNSENKEYRELFEVVKEKLINSALSFETASTVADLMVRYDEDVYETDKGEFFCYSNNPKNYEI